MSHAPVFRLLIIVIFLGCFMGNNEVPADSFEETGELFQKSIDGRNKIKSGQMILKSEYQGCENRQVHPSSYTMEIAFSSDRFFIRKKDGDRVNYYCSNCDVPGSFVFVNLQPILHVDSSHPKLGSQNISSQSEYPDAIMVFHENDHILKEHQNSALRLEKHIDTRDYSIPDFLQMGVVPENSFSPPANPMENLTWVFQSYPDKKTDQLPFIEVYPVTEESIGNDLCKKISWNVTSKLKFATGQAMPQDPPIIVKTEHVFWIDPLKDFIVRKAIFKAGAWENSLINEIAQDSQSKIWYPSHWVYELRNGDKVLEREECDLQMIALNTSSPSQQLFSCRNIQELVPGTPVRWQMDAPPPAEGRLVWDGKKVVGLGEYKFGIITRDSDRSRRYFLFFLNTAVISAIIAIQYFRAWRRQKNGQKNAGKQGE